MAVKLIATSHRYIGASTDTKPSGVAIGSVFFEYDTELWYIYSGSGWEIDSHKVKVNSILDSTGSEFKQDTTTGAFAILGYEHNEIHSGDHYNYCDYALSLGSGDIVEFVLTTPDTTEWTHFVFYVFSSTGAVIEIYEGATGITGGTAVTPRNNNRNFSDSSALVLKKDPDSITSDGTRAAGYLAGANRTAGVVERGNENVLKQNTTYLLRITSSASSNNISWVGEWYEHTNR